MQPNASAGRPGTLLVLVLLVAGACGGLTDTDIRALHRADTIEARVEGNIDFIRMSEPPADTLDAVFEGRVIADPTGCFRLESADGPTVVWPVGYDFDADGAAIRVLDADDDLVGEVEGSFRLPGGEVPTLDAEFGFTDADRRLADALCPGRYWLVAPD